VGWWDGGIAAFYAGAMCHVVGVRDQSGPFPSLWARVGPNPKPDFSGDFIRRVARLTRSETKQERRST